MFFPLLGCTRAQRTARTSSRGKPEKLERRRHGRARGPGAETVPSRSRPLSALRSPLFLSDAGVLFQSRCNRRALNTPVFLESGRGKPASPTERTHPPGPAQAAAERAPGPPPPPRAPRRRRPPRTGPGPPAAFVRANRLPTADGKLSPGAPAARPAQLLQRNRRRPRPPPPAPRRHRRREGRSAPPGPARRRTPRRRRRRRGGAAPPWAGGRPAPAPAPPNGAQRERAGQAAAPPAPGSPLPQAEGPRRGRGKRSAAPPSLPAYLPRPAAQPLPAPKARGSAAPRKAEPASRARYSGGDTDDDNGSASPAPPSAAPPPPPLPRAPSAAGRPQARPMGGLARLAGALAGRAFPLARYPCFGNRHFWLVAAGKRFAADWLAAWRTPPPPLLFPCSWLQSGARL